MTEITEPTALRDLYGTISLLAQRKVMAHLDHHCRAFIALSPFLVLASCDEAGNADASPRGDARGFVAVLDDNTLLIPDRPGNNRVDSYGNVIAHPGIGLIFFVPGIDETLRVNGAARVIDDAVLLNTLAANGKAPKAGLAVQVKEAFFHCGKALKRSQLWSAGNHVERRTFPTLGQIIAEQTGQCSSEEAEARIESDYRLKLY